MPRAEKSLRQHLNEAEGKLTTEESLSILTDVAEALAGLQQDVVHRDLKSENILFYQDHWCLADFGIARYAEATTARDTHKYAFTAPYAAPEQWRVERATLATDVYAFGVAAFELLQGHRPFSGPDYREQHLNHAPPSLVGCPPSIATLVTECLFKPPQARPTPANILARLRRSQRPSSPAAAQLQAANQMIVDNQAQAEATASAQNSTEERRRELFNTARQSLETILEELIEQVLNAAPSASVTRSPYLIIQLGNGSLSVNTTQPTPPKSLAAFGGPPAFDVIAHTAIIVHQPRDQYDYEGRSHSLWFCDAYDEGVYRWFETARAESGRTARLTRAVMEKRTLSLIASSWSVIGLIAFILFGQHLTLLSFAFVLLLQLILNLYLGKDNGRPSASEERSSASEIVAIRLQMTDGTEAAFQEWLNDPARLKHYIDTFNQPSSTVKPLRAIFVFRTCSSVVVDVSEGTQNNLQLNELLSYLKH